MSTANCKISSFVGGSDSMPVITVNFDCGQLMEEDTRGITCDVLSTTSSRREKRKRVVLLDRKNQTYSGVPGQAESICNTLFLIRNRKTGKAKLVSSTSCQLVNRTLRPSSRISSVLEDAGDSRKKLADVFGSKRSKRQSEIAERMRTTAVSQSAILDETITNVMGSAELKKEAPSDNELVQKLLPPCNREASRVEDVYKIDGLLNPAELEELRGLAELYISSPDDVRKESQFLMLPFYESLGDRRTVTQVQLLLYANFIVNFTRLPYPQLRARTAASNICSYSRMIGEKIFQEFTVLAGSNRVRTDDSTDRAYCHAVVVVLLACDFQFNANWFFKCLKGCRKSKLQPLLRAVGLVPRRGAKESEPTHTFKVPLPPISLTSKGKRKKT